MRITGISPKYQLLVSTCDAPTFPLDQKYIIHRQYYFFVSAPPKSVKCNSFLCHKNSCSTFICLSPPWRITDRSEFDFSSKRILSFAWSMTNPHIETIWDWWCCSELFIPRRRCSETGKDTSYSSEVSKGKKRSLLSSGLAGFIHSWDDTAQRDYSQQFSFATLAAKSKSFLQKLFI